MKGCLRFFILIFWTLQNLARYVYWWLSLKHCHKFVKVKHWWHDGFYIGFSLDIFRFKLLFHLMQFPMEIKSTFCLKKLYKWWKKGEKTL